MNFQKDWLLSCDFIVIFSLILPSNNLFPDSLFVIYRFIFFICFKFNQTNCFANGYSAQSFFCRFFTFQSGLIFHYPIWSDFFLSNLVWFFTIQSGLIFLYPIWSDFSYICFKTSFSFQELGLRCSYEKIKCKIDSDKYSSWRELIAKTTQLWKLMWFYSYYLMNSIFCVFIYLIYCNLEFK